MSDRFLAQQLAEAAERAKIELSEREEPLSPWPSPVAAAR